ncbi:MAG TPA: hypothetical protein VNR00_14165 [Opitutus sp.]|nr:hypothetical protein [Opitutus sp.]
MNIVSLLLRFNAFSAAVSALALAFNAHPLAFYCVAASAFLLLIAAADYAPPARRWEPAAVRARLRAHREQSLALAV